MCTALADCAGGFQATPKVLCEYRDELDGGQLKKLPSKVRFDGEEEVAAEVRDQMATVLEGPSGGTGTHDHSGQVIPSML